MQRRLDCNIETITTVRRRAEPGTGLESTDASIAGCKLQGISQDKRKGWAGLDWDLDLDLSYWERQGKRGLKKSEKHGLGAACVVVSSCVKGGGALVDVGGKNTSPTGQQITMHDVPLMDAADVSPTMV